MKVIAIIPARGGSKGVPKKNIYPILNKPLIAYTIEAALESKKIDTIWVSSDEEEILDICRAYDNVNLHKRSSEIALDNSSVLDTIKVVLDSAKSTYDAIMLLQPTSPLKTGKQIDESIALLEKNEHASSVVSVCKMTDVHPARMYWKKDTLEPIMPEFEQVRRQDIPPAYYRNGCIYLVRTNAFITTGQVMAKPALPYEMPTNWLLNIDEPRDILIAEPLIKAWKSGHL